MVLLERIELSTSSLPMTRSTTELQQPEGASPIGEGARDVKLAARTFRPHVPLP